MQKARQIGTELLLALTWACMLMLIILPVVLFLLQVLSLVTALPFASWPEALDLREIGQAPSSATEYDELCTMA